MDETALPASLFHDRGKLVLVVITAGLLWHFSTSFPPFGQQFEVAGEIIAELVPPVEASPQAQQEAIERLAERIGTDLALFSRTNEPLASAGRPLPAPGRSGRTGGWLRTAGGPAVAIRSRTDGGWLHAYRRGSARAR